jgi:hypothetical protein
VTFSSRRNIEWRRIDPSRSRLRSRWADAAATSDILDEPTNPLDLRSLEAVEAVLKAYDGALLVVSHDEMFLESIGVSRRAELE